MSTVYGPTTIDRQNGDANDGLSNNSLIFSTQFPRIKLRRRLIRILPVVLSVTFFIFGVAFLLAGGIQRVYNSRSFCILIIVGVVFMLLSSVFFLFFLRQSGRLHCFSKKTHLDVAGKHVSTNPSTDLLVSATYPPVSDVAYQQSQGDTEDSRLMVQENGNISNEDADRMVASDPRIVLRPLKSAHEDC